MLSYSQHKLMPKVDPGAATSDTEWRTNAAYRVSSNVFKKRDESLILGFFEIFLLGMMRVGGGLVGMLLRAYYNDCAEESASTVLKPPFTLSISF